MCECEAGLVCVRGSDCAKEMERYGDSAVRRAYVCVRSWDSSTVGLFVQRLRLKTGPEQEVVICVLGNRALPSGPWALTRWLCAYVCVLVPLT